MTTSATPPPLPPSGWYPDVNVPGTSRYWDGAAWTPAVRSDAPPPPAAPTSVTTKSTAPWSRWGISTWVVGGIAALVLIITAFTGGIGGVLLTLSLFAFFSALYALITGRKSWARIASRKVAGVIAGASIVLLFRRLGHLGLRNGSGCRVIRFADGPRIRDTVGDAEAFSKTEAGQLLLRRRARRP